MNEISLDCGVCILRPFRVYDAESLVRYANNPNIVRWLRDRFPHPYTFEHAREFLERVCSPSERDNEFVLAIDVHGEPVGGIGLILGHDIDRVSAELGYWLAEPFWGRGIVTASIRTFAPWAMERFSLTRLFADVFPENPASGRVLEKCGFTRECIKRRAVIKRGEIHDLHSYVLIK